MERLQRVVGPLATNVHVLVDPHSREAIAIDTATPCLAWITGELAARDWTLKLIVSSHGHWDHIGDNAAVASICARNLTDDTKDDYGYRPAVEVMVTELRRSVR